MGRIARSAMSALIALAAGWAATPAAQAQPLKIALRQDTDVLDPTLTTTYVGRIIFAGLCDKLFDIDEKLTIVPQLATGYKWENDRTLILNLRPGVKFHNDESFDAEAVRFSFDRHLNLQGSFRRSEIAAIDRVEVVDPATARVVLKQPSGAFIAQLTDRSGMIFPPKATAAAGKDFGRNPICSGPFKFAERVAQDHVTLERFAGYWDAGAIHFDKVTYQVLVDPSVRLANLKAGTVHLAEYVTPTDAAVVKADPKLRLVVSDALGYFGITNNLANGARADNPYGKNALVRQALDLAIDRKALVGVVFNDMFAPTVQPVPQSSPFYDPAQPPPARDLDKAKALLKQAGVALPVKLDILVINDADNLQAAEVVQAMAAEAGFEVRIQAMEFASSLSTARNGDYQAYMIGWSGRVDVDGNTYQFLRTGQGNNWSAYSSPVVDAALEEGRGTTDLAQRKPIYARAIAQERLDLPITYLWTPRNIVGMTAKLQGFQPVPDGMIRLQGLRMAP